MHIDVKNTKSFTDLFKGSDINQEAISENLFTDTCPTGYFSKEDLINHLNGLSESQKDKWQLDHLKVLFDFCKVNGTLSRDPQHSVEDGRDITWLNLMVGRVKKPIKIIHFANIKELIDDYASGNLKINQSLEELYNEALS